MKDHTVQALEFYLSHQGYRKGTKRYDRYRMELMIHGEEVIMRLATQRGFKA